MGSCYLQPRLQRRSCSSNCAPASPSLWVLSQRPGFCTRRKSVLPADCMSNQQRMATSASAGSVQSPSAPRPLRLLQRWSQSIEGLSWGIRTRSQALQTGSAPQGRSYGLWSRLYARFVGAAAYEGVTADTFKASSSSLGAGPRHLIVMANGLFGSASNWDVICDQLEQHLDSKDTLLHPSTTNSKFETYEGIDRCGTRLAQEIRHLVSEHPSLTRITIIAHSMGGLMARYAVGVLYNPDSRMICGLEPCHFVTLATPHFGCDADGVAQVPFIGWTGGLPLLGPHLFRVLQDISATTAAAIFRDTGKQFFMLDGSSQQQQQQSVGGGCDIAADSSSTAHLPVLFQMTQDCPDRGLYFYSALSAFKTRTCYANTDGDHLVGYANSSIRSLPELPALPSAAATAKGVVLEDPLTAAYFPHQWQQLQQRWERQQRTNVSSGDPLAAAAQLAQSPYQPSRHWTAAAAAAAGVFDRGAAGAQSVDNSSSWRELGTAHSSSRRPAPHQQQQQQPDRKQTSNAGTIAALELAVAGAAAAATEAVADLLSPLLPSQQQQQQQPIMSVQGGSADEMLQLDSGPASADTDYSFFSSSSNSGGSSSSNADVEASLQAAAAEDDLASGLSSGGTTAAASSRQSAAEAVAADTAVLESTMTDRAQMVAHMLRRLQELPWRRVDVSFRGARFGFAHNNIQVTRRWWNFEGEQVPRHLAQQLQVMEAVLQVAAGDSSSSSKGALEVTDTVAVSGAMGENAAVAVQPDNSEVDDAAGVPWPAV